MRLIITGGSGLLALNWAILCRDSYDILLLTHTKSVALSGVSSIKVDLEDRERLGEIISQWCPDVIVHAAGMTNVDECEKFPERAYYTNTDLVKQVSLIAKQHSIKFVYISSDHIFNGNKPFATESDKADPLNVYANSKLLGESAARFVDKNCLILRTNFFGWGTGVKPSFSDWVINTIRNKEEIQAYTDIFYTPIFIHHFVDIAIKLIQKDCHGVFNVVGSSRVSKYEFIMSIVEQFDLDASLVKKSAYRDTKSSVKRPLDMSLSNSLVKNELKVDFLGLDQSFVELRLQEESGVRDEINSCIV